MSESRPDPMDVERVLEGSTGRSPCSRARRGPGTQIASTRWSAVPQETFEWLIEAEDEAIAALHGVIADSGQEPRSEALEHLLEHVIMRSRTGGPAAAGDPHP